jgi:hypothetical protein
MNFPWKFPRKKLQIIFSKWSMLKKGIFYQLILTLFSDFFRTSDLNADLPFLMTCRQCISRNMFRFHFFSR